MSLISRSAPRETRGEANSKPRATPQRRDKQWRSSQGGDFFPARIGEVQGHRAIFAQEARTSPPNMSKSSKIGRIEAGTGLD
jgi:hypothetical protein